MKRISAALLVAAVLCGGSSPAPGQELRPLKQRSQAATIHTYQLDDGSPEAFFFDSADDGEIAQRFDLLHPNGTLLSVELCFVRNGGVGTFEFELKFWEDLDSIPSSFELASYDLEAADLSAASVDCRTYPINANFAMDTPYLWAGIDWSGSDSSFGIAADTTPKAPPARIAIDQGEGWQLVSSDAATAIFLRMTVDHPNGGGGGTDSCQPSATVLCISDQPGDRRFEAIVSFDTISGGGASGSARAIELASLGVQRGGLFWFFSIDNPEVLLKVLNGCSLNGHYWVFYSAATTVGLDVRVRDTKTGLTWQRTNVDGFSAQPVNDIQAFACQ